MAQFDKLIFGSYEVVQQNDGEPWILGRGSFGVTYRAKHVLLGRTSALKVIRQDLLDRGKQESQQETGRFLDEARAVGKLSHPGIAMVHDCALADGVFYYAMEYCDGGTLQEWCEKHGPMPWPEVLEIALQMLSALDYAHRCGFLHRDIKPANIMLSGKGRERQAKLIDFGLAQRFDPESATSSATVRNDSDHFRGNFATASPEQILEQPLDPRSDLFSLGVTLWWLLSGKNPFGELKRGALIADRIGPSPYSALLPDDLNKMARSLLEGLLEKDPAKRFANAQQVSDWLRIRNEEFAGPDETPVSLTLSPLTCPPDFEEHYTLGGILRASGQGNLYSGIHLKTIEPVIVLIPGVKMESDAVAGLRIAASQKFDFGAFVSLDWLRSGTEDVFVFSKPEGCSLLNILRKFGPASFGDAYPLLLQLARSFDASQEWIGYGVQVDPGEIFVRTRDGSFELSHFRSWAELDPQGARCLPFFTSDGDHAATNEATLAVSAQEFSPLAQFAALVYRVVAGSAVRYAAFFTSSGYVMASGLSEDGNALLAETISAPETQPSACRFLQLLTGVEALNSGEITPLFQPPTCEEIESAKLPLLENPVKGGSQFSSLNHAASDISDHSASVNQRVAALERELALAKIAALEEDQKSREESARKEAEEARRQAEETEALLQAEEARRQAVEAEALRQAEEARRQAVEAETLRQAEEVRCQAVETEALRQAEEVRRQAVEAETLRQAEEVRCQAVETEALRQAEEVRRQALEAEALRQAEEVRRQAVEAEAFRQAEEARRQAKEAEALRQAEEEKRQTLEAEALRQAEVVRHQAVEVEALRQAEERRSRAPQDSTMAKTNARLGPLPSIDLPTRPLTEVRHGQVRPVKSGSLSRPVVITALAATLALVAGCLFFFRNATQQFSEKNVPSAPADLPIVVHPVVPIEPEIKPSPKSPKIQLSITPSGGKTNHYRYVTEPKHDGQGIFEVEPQSAIIITLFDTQNGVLKDQEIATFECRLPDVKETRALEIKLPPTLPSISFVNRYGNNEYTRLSVAPTNPIKGQEIKIPADVSTYSLKSSEAYSSIIDKELDIPRKTDRPLVIPIPGPKEWTITYKKEKFPEIKAQVALGGGELRELTVPANLGGIYSIATTPMPFPQEKDRSSMPRKRTQDYVEFDYHNRQIYTYDNKAEEAEEDLKLLKADRYFSPKTFQGSRQNMFENLKNITHSFAILCDLDSQKKDGILGAISLLIIYPDRKIHVFRGKIDDLVIAENRVVLKGNYLKFESLPVLRDDLFSEQHQSLLGDGQQQPPVRGRRMAELYGKLSNQWLDYQVGKKPIGEPLFDIQSFLPHSQPLTFAFELEFGRDGENLDLRKVSQIYRQGDPEQHKQPNGQPWYFLDEEYRRMEVRQVFIDNREGTAPSMKKH